MTDGEQQQDEVHRPPDAGRLSVNYSLEGEPEEIVVGYPETSGMVWFQIRDGTAKYDGHVHSVDRDAAEEAAQRLPFINEVDMSYER